MPEAIFIFFLAIAIIAVTALLFGGWVVVTLLKWVFRGLASLGGLDSSQQSTHRTCINQMCGARNLQDARFCRRCGQAMPGVQTPAMRRVA